MGTGAAHSSRPFIGKSDGVAGRSARRRPMQPSILPFCGQSPLFGHQTRRTVAKTQCTMWSPGNQSQRLLGKFGMRLKVSRRTRPRWPEAGSAIPENLKKCPARPQKSLGKLGISSRLTLQEDLGLSRQAGLKWHSQSALTYAQAKQALHATKQPWKIFNELMLGTFVRTLNKRYSKTKTYFNQ